MNCLQAEEHFSAYFEDTLNSQILRDFKTHLAECEACQNEYTQFQESVKAVQQLPQMEPSPDFMPKLLERLVSEQQHPFSGIKEIITIGLTRLQEGLRRPRWAFSALVVLILAIGGYFYQGGLFSNRDSQPPVVVTPARDGARVATPSIEVPVEGPRQGRSTDSLQRFPTQQHYVLKQVSYTHASTSGGL